MRKKHYNCNYEEKMERFHEPSRESIYVPVPEKWLKDSLITSTTSDSPLPPGLIGNITLYQHFDKQEKVGSVVRRIISSCNPEYKFYSFLQEKELAAEFHCNGKGFARNVLCG